MSGNTRIKKRIWQETAKSFARGFAALETGQAARYLNFAEATGGMQLPQSAFRVSTESTCGAHAPSFLSASARILAGKVETDIVSKAMVRFISPLLRAPRPHGRVLFLGSLSSVWRDLALPKLSPNQRRA